MKDTKVVITNFGSCSAAGTSDSLWDHTIQKKSCLSFYENSSLKDCPVKIVGRVPTRLKGIFPKKVESFISRHALLGAASMQECLKDSCLEKTANNRTGLIFGSASLGQDRAEIVFQNIYAKPFPEINYNIVNSISNAGACHLIASHFNINGYIHAVEGASSSGMISIITGNNLIKSGLCDRVFCVVGEANLFPGTFLFYSRRARLSGVSLSFFGKLTNPEFRTPENFIVPFCSPNFSDRGAIAEGGGTIMLESLASALARKVKIHGVLEDFSFFFHSDNYNGGDKELIGLKNILEKYKDIKFDSLYLPFTGNYPLDVAMSMACSQYFPNTHTFTVEPIIGHTGAASSMINSVLALMSINNNVLLPTGNILFDKFDPNFQLSPSNEVIKKSEVKRIMIISPGWGGYHVACIIKKYE